MARKPRREAQEDDNTGGANNPSRIDLGWSPFHVAARDYYEAGFIPIPLPQGKKYPPPVGTPNDIEYDESVLQAWIDGTYTNRVGTIRHDPSPKNIGLIVPDGVVVFDVDGPTGKETLAELEKELGPLPPTWVTFRGDPDRYHMWFLVPPGMTWPGKLGAGLDVIYRHYRYMVAPPSVHPSGQQYRWANMRRNALVPSVGYLPTPDEFADLPEAWLAVSNGSKYQRRDRAQVDARLWMKEHGTGDLCPEMKRVMLRHKREIRKHADLGGMHDSMVNAVWAVLAEVSQGHPGGYEALSEIKETFLIQAEQSGRREGNSADLEWSRACIGAIEKTAIEKVRHGDPCTIEEPERGKDPGRFFDPKHGLKSTSIRRAVERTGKLAVGPGKTIYRHTDGFWTPDGESEVYRRVTKLLGQRYRPSHATNVLSVIENREAFITDDRVDTKYLNLPNGLLDWQEGKLYPHNPAIVSTIRIPVEWDEDATCPEIDEFFSQVFPPDAVELAYEILGYMLFNENPLHKAILLYGTGRNGKGTFLRLARMLVGHANISSVTPQALDESRFASSQLYGKLANLVGDVDPRIFKSTEQFKQLTGGDYMQGEEKHKTGFVFLCRALMVAAFNSLPRTADTTEGFFSRWVVIPFTGFFPAGKADPTLIYRLTTPEAMRGLLRGAVGGLQQVMRRGTFTIPESVRKATQRFRDEADPMRGFIEERVEVTHSNDPHFTPRTDIYTAYTAWAGVNGFSAMNAQNFYEKFTTAVADISEGKAIPATIRGVRGYKSVTMR